MPRQADRVTSEDGFTLLEAIVALVILSTALVGFYDFLSTTLNGARRVQTASIAYDRRANALELATTINPMEMPEGSFALGRYHINWDSQRVNDVRQSSRYPYGPGLFKIALYRVTFSFPDDRDIPPVAVTKLGYHRDDVPYDMTTPNSPTKRR